MRFFMICGSLLLACTLSSSGFAKAFYKWVDANGSTHYSETPPPQDSKKLGQIQTIDDTPSGAVSHGETPHAANQQNSENQNNTQTSQQPSNSHQKTKNTGEKQSSSQAPVKTTTATPAQTAQ